MDKQTAKRMHAIRELLQTERDYVVDLGRLVEVDIYIAWIRAHGLT